MPVTGENTRRGPHLKIRTAVPLSRYTTFRIGGPADSFCTVRSVGSLVFLVREAIDRRERFFILGSGSNVLFSDQGFRGLIIRNCCRRFRIRGDRIISQSGAGLSDLVEAACRSGLSGMEAFAGIPGTLGGAVCGNAGAFGHSIGELLCEATILDRAGRIRTVGPEYFSFRYRSSFIKTSGDVLLEAGLRLSPGPPEGIAQKMEEIRAQRASKHPRGLPCAGSFFKNLPPPEGESQRVPAGKLLEMAGAKGMRVGGAAVFRGHANFIVNLGGATAAEVLELAARIRSAVKREFGVELEEEVMLIDPEYSPPEESLPTYSIL